jgi:hypothetical protein
MSIVLEKIAIMEESREKARKAAKDTGDYVKSKADQVSKYVKDKAGKAADQANQAGQYVKGKANQATQYVKGKTEKPADAAVQAGEKLKNSKAGQKMIALSKNPAVRGALAGVAASYAYNKLKGKEKK